MAGTRKLVVEILGDAKGVTKAFGESEKAADGFGSKMAGLGKAAAIGTAALGGAAVVGAKVLVDWGKAAAEDEKAQAALAKTIENVTGAGKDQAAGLEEWITQQGKAVGVADDELRPALDSLIRGTGDLGKSTELAGLAMDVSAGTGKDLVAVSDALSKAYNGQLGPLKKLDPALAGLIKDGASFEEVQAQLNKTFGGQAQEAAKSTAGQMKIAQLQFDEFKETVGAKVLPILAKFATFATTKLIPALERFGAWAGEKLPPILSAIGEFIETKVIPALRTLGQWLGEKIPPILSAIGDFITSKVIPALQSFGHWVNDEIVPALGKLWASFEENILPALQKVAGFIQDKVLPVLALLGEWIVTKVLPVIGMLVVFLLEKLIPATFEVYGFILEKLLPVFEKIAVFIRDKVIPAVQEMVKWISDASLKIIGFVTTVSNKIGEVVAFVAGLPERISNAAKGLWEGLKNGLEAVVQWVTEKVDKLLGPVDELLSKIGRLGFGQGNSLAGAMADAENSQRRDINGNGVIGRHTGGMVFRDGMYNLRRGERVQTPTQAASGPSVLVLQLGDREVARVLVPALEQEWRDRGGARLQLAPGFG